jgi:uncharacterized protein with HEPN domain
VLHRDWRTRLQDIIEAAEWVERYTAGLDFEEFAANRMVVDAVTRNVEIAGEAARHIPTSIAEKYPDVPWRLMSDMRNVLIHNYPGVDLGVIWRTIRDDLPPSVVRPREILDLERAAERD